MNDEIKREEEWEDISHSDTSSEDSETYTSDDVNLGELLTRMSIWTDATARRMDIMAGERYNQFEIYL